MLCDGHIVAELRFGRRCIGPDGCLVLTVGGDEHRAFLEDAFQHGCVVDEHVAGGAAHEHLDAADPFRVGLQDLVEVAVGGAHEEAVVRGADFSGPVVLVLEQVLGEGLRHGVGHLHEGGDAARDGRA